MARGIAFSLVRLCILWPAVPPLVSALSDVRRGPQGSSYTGQCVCSGIVKVTAFFEDVDLISNWICEWRPNASFWLVAQVNLLEHRYFAKYGRWWLVSAFKFAERRLIYGRILLIASLLVRTIIIELEICVLLCFTLFFYFEIVE